MSHQTTGWNGTVAYVSLSEPVELVAILAMEKAALPVGLEPGLNDSEAVEWHEGENSILPPNSYLHTILILIYMLL